MPLINWQAFAVVASGFACGNVYVAHANRKRYRADTTIHQAIENLNLHCGVFLREVASAAFRFLDKPDLLLRRDHSSQVIQLSTMACEVTTQLDEEIAHGASFVMRRCIGHLAR